MRDFFLRDVVHVFLQTWRYTPGVLLLYGAAAGGLVLLVRLVWAWWVRDWMRGRRERRGFPVLPCDWRKEKTPPPRK